MPAPRNQDPQKVYFSFSEALKMLECPKHWLKYWTAKSGFKTRPDSNGRHRYTAKDLNVLMEIRKLYGIHSKRSSGQFRIEKARKEYGSLDLEAETNAVQESENRP